MKYEYTDKCREISGFGGGYENTCRDMVIAGVEWFDKNKNKKPVFKEFSNITGVICDENEDAKELSGHMAKAANDDCTGAMMQASINHVLYAVKNGWNQYIIDMETKV